MRLSDVSQLLRQVRLIDPLKETDQIVDVLILEGKIAEISRHIENIPENIPIQEANHLILAPGLVDLYSHSGEPGYEERETLNTLIASAQAGGISRLNILPTTHPKPDNTATLSGLKRLISPVYSPCVGFWANLTLKGKGEQLTELGELAESGITGFTDNAPIENLELLRRLLEYLKPFNLPIALYPLNRQLRGTGVMREGKPSILYGLSGDPYISETSALTAILELVELTGTPVHLMRISTARSVELIAQAKQKGLPITASVTGLHLLGNTENLATYNPHWRLDPPLGNLEDQEALIDGVKMGIIDAIAFDHTPYTYEEKTVAFADAPAGAIGLELTLPLLWDTLVKSEKWSAITLWKALSSNPCLCLNQPPISCEIGQPSQLILFDPHKRWRVDRENLHSLGQNTPWWGQTITGKVIG